jgi:Transposase
VIGIDPHRGSHTAAVLDGTEELVDEFWVLADRRQRQRLLEWAAPFSPRVWAVEGATGTGALLAQQLIAAGEQVLDVPPALSARVRLLDSGRSDKTDSHDARAAAVVALSHRSLRPVRVEDHLVVLRGAGQAASRPGRHPDPCGVPPARHTVPLGRRPLLQADDRPAGLGHPRPRPAPRPGVGGAQGRGP